MAAVLNIKCIYPSVVTPNKRSYLGCQIDTQPCILRWKGTGPTTLLIQNVLSSIVPSLLSTYLQSRWAQLQGQSELCNLHD